MTWHYYLCRRLPGDSAGPVFRSAAYGNDGPNVLTALLQIAQQSGGWIESYAEEVQR